MGDDGSEIGGHGLANVRKRAAQPQVHALANRRPEGNQGDVFAGVIGSRSGGVAAVVGGENGQVAGTHGAFEFGQPGVELFQRRAVALDIVAMAVLLIEIEQVDEDQAGSMESSASSVLAMPSALFLVFSVSRMPRPRNTSKILPTA